MMDEDPLMNDEQAGDAVARYFEENPELLQGIVPERDLWPAIESRISARVIPMPAPGRRAGGRSLRWMPALIAASLLIAGTAGITYVVVTRANAPAVNSVAIGGAAAGGPARASIPAGQGASQLGQASPGDTTLERGNVSGNGNTFAAQPATGPAVRLASRDGGLAAGGVRKTYDAEIASLHATLETRRSQLNPATVAIIEQNLSVIDEAIRQSEAALARDPGSRLLNDQLDRTLAKKTGLLRAAVLLPAA